jgi:hypothetical protein
LGVIITIVLYLSFSSLTTIIFPVFSSRVNGPALALSWSGSGPGSKEAPFR